MRVEAIKKKDGLLIPMLDEFRNVKHEKITLDVEIVNPDEPDEYAALDKLVGLCETKRTDASTKHDSIIYNVRDDNDLH